MTNPTGMVPCTPHGRYACGICFTGTPMWSVPYSAPGWQCPGCARCYAPTVTMCSFCGPKVEPTCEVKIP